MRRYDQSTVKGVGADHPRKDHRGIEWMGDAISSINRRPEMAVFLF